MKQRIIKRIQVTPTFRGLEGRDADGVEHVFPWDRVSKVQDRLWRAFDDEGQYICHNGRPISLDVMRTRESRIGTRLQLRAWKRAAETGTLEVTFACREKNVLLLSLSVMGTLTFACMTVLFWSKLDFETVSTGFGFSEFGFGQTSFVAIVIILFAWPLGLLLCLFGIFFYGVLEPRRPEIVKQLHLNCTAAKFVFQDGRRETRRLSDLVRFRNNVFLFNDGLKARLVFFDGYLRLPLAIWALCTIDQIPDNSSWVMRSRILSTIAFFIMASLSMHFVHTVLTESAILQAQARVSESDIAPNPRGVVIIIGMCWSAGLLLVWHPLSTMLLLRCLRVRWWQRKLQRYNRTKNSERNAQ